MSLSKCVIQHGCDDYSHQGCTWPADYVTSSRVKGPASRYDLWRMARRTRTRPYSDTPDPFGTRVLSLHALLIWWEQNISAR